MLEPELKEQQDQGPGRNHIKYTEDSRKLSSPNLWRPSERAVAGEREDEKQRGRTGYGKEREGGFKKGK